MAIVNMSEKPVSDKPAIPTLPKGTYNSVISGVWDIGLQEKEWQGVKSIVRQIVIRVEVSKTIEAEGSDLHGKRYAPVSWITVYDGYSEKANLVKIAEAALQRDMNAADFAAFDTDCLIGKNLTVTIGHTKPKDPTKQGNAKITDYARQMEGMPTLTPELTPETPQWIIDRFNAGAPDQGQQQQAPAPGDDLPF
jgi:hypothetical protein